MMMFDECDPLTFLERSHSSLVEAENELVAQTTLQRTPSQEQRLEAMLKS
jgi:hypothetical protein